MAVCLAHLSDVHLSAPACRWRLHDWCSKRLTGWLHLRCLGRGRSFVRADDAVAALIAELNGAHRPDCTVFSGDATALGFPEEIARAAALLGVGAAAAPPGLAVPGNHDYYTRRDARSGTFERCFAAWQSGERVDEAPYPFARQIGPLWLIGVNSSAGKIWPWDASGQVGSEQLGRLEKLLARLSPGLRILVTHFPVAKPDGQPESFDHRLHDLADLLRVAERGGVCLWLHGHEHRPYRIDDRRLAPFPVICAGSATQSGKWGYNVYSIEGLQLRARRRVFDPERALFQPGESFELGLHG